MEPVRTIIKGRRDMDIKKEEQKEIKLIWSDPRKWTEEELRFYWLTGIIPDTKWNR